MITITTKRGHVFQLRHDGYRVYSKQVSALPLRHNYDEMPHPIIPMPQGGWDEEVLFEWKHSGATCADDIIEALLPQGMQD